MTLYDLTMAFHNGAMRPDEVGSYGGHLLRIVDAASTTTKATASLDGVFHM